MKPNNTDYTGQRFGRLTVLWRDTEYTARKDGSRTRLWNLQCDCGNTVKSDPAPLLRGRKTSCGCNKYLPKAHDRSSLAKPSPVGQRFGQLFVTGRAEESAVDPSGRRRGLWICLCDCGTTTALPRDSFEKKGQKSCGCLGRDRKGKVDNKRRPDDVTGQKFGKLTAVERLALSRDNSYNWLCKCDCGNEAIVSLKSLRLATGRGSGRKTKGNCGDPKYHDGEFGLKYPPMPVPMPEFTAGLISKYTCLINKKIISMAIEDELYRRLYRACWIIDYRLRRGEAMTELHQRRFIQKWLRYAKTAAGVKAVDERNGGRRRYTVNRVVNKEIGSEMANLNIQLETGDSSRSEFCVFKPKKRVFGVKTC